MASEPKSQPMRSSLKQGLQFHQGAQMQQRMMCWWTTSLSLDRRSNLFPIVGRYIWECNITLLMMVKSFMLWTSQILVWYNPYAWRGNFPVFSWCWQSLFITLGEWWSWTAVSLVCFRLWLSWLLLVCTGQQLSRSDGMAEIHQQRQHWFAFRFLGSWSHRNYFIWRKRIMLWTIANFGMR